MRWPSFLEDMCAETGLVTENLYSVFTFQPLHKLYLGVSKLLKSRLDQCLSFEDVYGHPAGPSEMQKRLSLAESASPESIERFYGAHWRERSAATAAYEPC